MGLSIDSAVDNAILMLTTSENQSFTLIVIFDFFLEENFYFYEQDRRC